jgi:hypothetical protein
MVVNGSGVRDRAGEKIFCVWDYDECVGYSRVEDARVCVGSAYRDGCLVLRVCPRLDVECVCRQLAEEVKRGKVS